MRELRSLTSRSALGGYRGGGGGCGSRLAGFSAIPQLELDKTPLPKGPVLGQISVLLGKWEKQASSDAADAGLCPLMLLMLAWACRLHMSQHDCLPLSGKEFICWIKTALRDMLDQSCSRQCCSLHFRLLRCGLAPAIKTAPRDVLAQNRSS